MLQEHPESVAQAAHRSDHRLGFRQRRIQQAPIVRQTVATPIAHLIIRINPNGDFEKFVEKENLPIDSVIYLERICVK